MTKVTRPEKPNKPFKFIEIQEERIRDGDKLQDILNLFPKDISFDKFFFMVDYDNEDEDEYFLACEIEESDESFNERWKQYEKELEIYEKWIARNQSTLQREEIEIKLTIINNRKKILEKELQKLTKEQEKLRGAPNDKSRNL